MSKILIVEDSQGFIDLLLYAINDAGYTDITIAKDGKEGLRKVQQQKFNLILSDIHMPKMDGLTMIKEIRNFDHYKKIPILVLSTEFSVEYKEKGKIAGANGWISKPFIPAQLIKAIGLCLNR